MEGPALEEVIDGLLGSSLPSDLLKGFEAALREGRADDAVQALLQAYATANRDLLPRVDSRPEVLFADTFFTEFFTPEDNEAATVATLQAVVDRLAGGRARKDLRYRATSITDGGDIAFGKGGEILVLGSDIATWAPDEMAAILAHEMSHNETRDFVKDRLAAGINDRAVAAVPADLKDAAKAAAQKARVHSQHQDEFGADRNAARLMEKAGFSPAGLVQVLERMAGTRQAPMPFLESDHPAVEERIRRLKEMGY